MVDAQNSTDMQNPYLEKSPARNILPRILEVAKHYQETFGNNEQNIKTKSFSECIKKNIILTKKVSHRRRHSLKHCLKQAFQRKYINAYESLSDRVKDGNTKQDDGEKILSKQQSIIQIYKQNVRKRLVDVEKMYTNILILEKSQNGFSRMT